MRAQRGKVGFMVENESIALKHFLKLMTIIPRGPGVREAPEFCVSVDSCDTRFVPI
jgi:hypothetical protein